MLPTYHHPFPATSRDEVALFERMFVDSSTRWCCCFLLGPVTEGYWEMKLNALLEPHVYSLFIKSQGVILTKVPGVHAYHF